MYKLDGLKEALTNCSYHLDKIQEHLLVFYEKFPALFTKTPKELSASEKLKLASQIIKLIESYTQEETE